MSNGNTFMECEGTYEGSGIVIFGAPFDSTTSYRPGTRFGPAAIRNEGYGFETFSPYLGKDLADIPVHDAGDLELPFGDTAKALDMIGDMTEKILTDEKIPIMLGGEHLVTLGAVRPTVKKYPELTVLQFDAHADMRDEFMGVKLSHATVMRRVWDMTGPGRIFQLGIRSGTKEEFAFSTEKNGIVMHRFDLDGLDEMIQSIKGRPVYMTVDLDVLDPSVFPGTGTPEPGGVDFDTLRRAVTKTCRELNIVGIDMNELSPHYDHSGISVAAACKLMREMLISLPK